MTTWFPVTCPTCGYKMDGHSAIGEEDAVPSAGALSLCIACGSLAVYADVLGQLVLRQPTGEERGEALQIPTLVAAMFAHRQARAANPDWPTGPNE